MSDERLDSAAHLPLLGEHAMSAEQIGDYLVVGHIGMHTNDLKGS